MGEACSKVQKLASLTCLGKQLECLEHKGHIMEEFRFYSADSGEH